MDFIIRHYSLSNAGNVTMQGYKTTLNKITPLRTLKRYSRIRKAS